MELLVKCILYFFIYAFIGWLIEVGAKLVKTGKFVNRGFLIGPICPIYGRAGVLFLFFIYDTNNVFLVFFKSILICSILEYAASYIMEKMFNARWWDYSNRKFNINGRICLGTMIPFGLLGVFYRYAMHPFFEGIVNLIDYKLQVFLAILLIVIYIIDNIIGYIVGFTIKNEIDDNRKDNTDIYKGKVYKWLKENGLVHKRIMEAFPGFNPIKKVANKIKTRKNR